MEITADNQVKMFVNCKKCYESMPSGESAESWGRMSVGWTEKGLQVWCVRHDLNVLNIDFEGHKHPGITYAKGASDGT